MKYEDLTPKMQELLNGLRHTSLTIDCDISDALEDAEDVEEFVENVVNGMENLAQEAYWWRKSILDVSKGLEELPHVMKPMFQIE